MINSLDEDFILLHDNKARNAGRERKMTLTQQEKAEILAYILQKYKEIPLIIRSVIPIGKLEQISIEDLPPLLKKCTIEELISLLQWAYRNGILPS